MRMVNQLAARKASASETIWRLIVHGSAQAAPVAYHLSPLAASAAGSADWLTKCLDHAAEIPTGRGGGAGDRAMRRLPACQVRRQLLRLQLFQAVPLQALAH